jgi:hypothetical protein
MAREGVGNLEAIELGLRQALFQDGRRLLEQLYAQADLCLADNASRPGEKCHPDRELELRSLFGPVALRRNYFYHPATATGRFPLDEALGLVESFSPALVRLACRAASADLAALAAIQIEGRQIHRLVNAIAPQLSAQLEQGQNTDPRAIPILYVEVDATGVPMVAEELAGRQGKQPDGSSKTYQCS